nr:MAG TPA: hypothetical protein [Caudoviricetes sp.]
MSLVLSSHTSRGLRHWLTPNTALMSEPPSPNFLIFSHSSRVAFLLSKIFLYIV